MRIQRRGQLYEPVSIEQGLALGLDEVEWERIVERLGRNPGAIECAVFRALWSEEVSRKSSRSLLEAIECSNQETRKLGGTDFGFLDLGDGRTLLVGASSNNRQSSLVSGLAAQACLDAALREILACGAEPLAVFDVLHFGLPEVGRGREQLLAAVNGLASFSAALGLPLVAGELRLEDCFQTSPMVNCFAAGLLGHRTTRPKAAVEPGWTVVYAGCETGREYFSSFQEVLHKSENSGPAAAVLAADSLLLGRFGSALAELNERQVPLEVVPLGGGGIAAGAFRMAGRIGRSMIIEAGRIPARKEGLLPREILLSETTERMLIVVEEKHHRDLATVLAKWDIPSVAIGEVFNEEGLVFVWNHYTIVDIPYYFGLTGLSQRSYEVVKFPPMLKRAVQKAPEQRLDEQWTRKDEWYVVRQSSTDTTEDNEDFSVPASLEDAWLDLLASPNLCSRRPLISCFDDYVGSNTVVGAGDDAAVVRLPAGIPAKDNLSARGLAFSLDSNSRYVRVDAYLGTVHTVAEGIRNLAAVGAKAIGLSHSLNFGDPGRYRDVCDLAESVRGISDSSRIWEVPVISEHVSLFNNCGAGSPMSTPVVLVCGLVEDVAASCHTRFAEDGDRIFLLGKTGNDIACSEYAAYFHNRLGRSLPDIDFEGEKAVCACIRSLVAQGLLRSAHDVGGGGLAAALAECCLDRPRPVGAVLYAEKTLPDEAWRPDALLFAETPGRFLLTCREADATRVLSATYNAGIAVTAQGTVGGREIAIKGAVSCSISLQTAYKIWAKQMERLLAPVVEAQ